jgi:hypothetical protein
VSFTDEADRPHNGDPEPGRPRWVTVSWIIAAVIAVVILAAVLFGGEHGPGVHSAPAKEGTSRASSITDLADW